MEKPNNLYFTKDHEWVTTKSGNTTIGVSSFAVEQLGDIVHVELPEVGTELVAGDPFGTIESTKTVSDLYAPVDGVVTEINESLTESPEELQDDVYNKGWLIKVDISSDPEGLMSHEEYEAYLASS